MTSEIITVVCLLIILACNIAIIVSSVIACREYDKAIAILRGEIKDAEQQLFGEEDNDGQ